MSWGLTHCDVSCSLSGYSVGAGHFLSPDSVEVVGGAPQYYQKGKVRPSCYLLF